MKSILVKISLMVFISFSSAYAQGETENAGVQTQTEKLNPTVEAFEKELSEAKTPAEKELILKKFLAANKDNPALISLLLEAAAEDDDIKTATITAQSSTYFSKDNQALILAVTAALCVERSSEKDAIVESLSKSFPSLETQITTKANNTIKGLNNIAGTAGAVNSGQAIEDNNRNNDIDRVDVDKAQNDNAEDNKQPNRSGDAT